MQTAILADVENPCDVLVIEAGSGAGFVPESLNRGFVESLTGGENLERHIPFQSLIDRAKHGPHAAAADPFLDPEVFQRYVCGIKQAV